MNKALVYATYGWLAASGVLHFAIDVVSQYVRGKRAPGLESTLYYGLNSAFALGQVAFGLLGLFLAWRAMSLLTQTPVMLLTIAAGLGWLAITFAFMQYREPRVSVGLFCVLAIAAASTR